MFLITTFLLCTQFWGLGKQKIPSGLASLEFSLWKSKYSLCNFRVFIINIDYVYVWLSVCRCLHTGQRCWLSLEGELQVFVNHLTRVLGTELESSRGAVQVCECWRHPSSSCEV